MEEGYQEQISVDASIRLKDIEERQRILKDRVLLIGKSFIEDKEQISETLREMKKNMLMLQKENERFKEIIKNITDQLGNTARRDELNIVKRQIDLMRT